MKQYKIKSMLANGYVGYFEIYGLTQEDALFAASLLLRKGEVILDITVIASV